MTASPSAAPTGSRILVVGAGVIGIASALALQRAGMVVTLIDRAAAGEGCSFGNAGMIQVGSSLPLAAPGILAQVPGMLWNPEGALSLRLGHLPALLPWGRKLLQNATPDGFARNEAALAALLAGARPAYEAMLRGTPAAEVFRNRGELYVVRSAQAFAGYATKIAACRRNGVPLDILDTAAIHDLEPLLAPDYSHGIYLPTSAYVVEPKALSQRMLDLFLGLGGRFETAEIVAREADTPSGLRLRSKDGRLFEGERLVLATGELAPELARLFGSRLPVEPMRGYHITLPLEGPALSGPVIEGEMNIAVTPMTGGNRVAGTLEFSGSKAAPNWRRAEMLLPMARRMLPSLPDRFVTRWHGDRPGTPDSLPFIGARKAEPRVIYACGHGMLGLTLAARTAQMVADLLAGPGLPTALAAVCSPDRF